MPETTTDWQPPSSNRIPEILRTSFESLRKWINKPWTPYVPTLTNVTLGNGTVVAFYRKFGKTVFYRFHLTSGTTTAWSAAAVAYMISLPFVPLNYQAGSGFLINGTTFVRTNGAIELQPGNSNLEMTVNGSAFFGVFGQQAPYNPPAGTVWAGSVTYETS